MTQMEEIIVEEISHNSDELIKQIHKDFSQTGFHFTRFSPKY